MSQELTPAQLERIKSQRAKRFQEMGLPPTAGQIMDVPVENVVTQRIYEQTTPVVQEQLAPQQESYPEQNYRTEIPNEGNIAQQIANQLAEERAMRQSVMYTAPRDKFNALEALRRGAKKSEMKEFVRAESSGVNGNQLPEPKVGRRPTTRYGQQQEKSKNAVQLTEFRAKRSEEAEALESIFTDRPSGINMRSTSNNGTLIETDENYSNVGASFDPVAHLKAKAAERGVNLDLQRRQPQQTNQVFQTENSSAQMEHLLLMMETMMKNQKSTYDTSALSSMMDTIAKRVAEETMKKVLREYVDAQKKKNTYEVISEEKRIIKANNKYYQLVPVKVNTTPNR